MDRIKSITGIQDNVEYQFVDTGWSSYQPYAYTWAALTLAAEKKGMDPYEYIHKYHKDGKSTLSLVNAINDVVPLAKPGIFGIGRKLPTTDEVLSEIKKEYGIDGKDAYDELVTRAANGEFR